MTNRYQFGASNKARYAPNFCAKNALRNQRASPGAKFLHYAPISTDVSVLLAVFLEAVHNHAIIDNILNIAHLFHALLERRASHSAAYKSRTTGRENAAVRGDRSVSKHVALSCYHFDRPGGVGGRCPVASIRAAAVKRDQAVVPDHAPTLRVGAGRHTDAECSHAENILHLTAPLWFAPNSVYLIPSKI